VEQAETMDRKRVIWSSGAKYDLPALPPQCYNELKIDIETLRRYIERHWGPFPPQQ
jgi:hypothetical protein